MQNFSPVFSKSNVRRCCHILDIVLALLASSKQLYTLCIQILKASVVVRILAVPALAEREVVDFLVTILMLSSSRSAARLSTRPM
jgi:hypothetical protein